MLLSLNFRNMICSPTLFKEYILANRVAKRILLLLLSSFAMSGEHLVIFAAQVENENVFFHLDADARQWESVRKYVYFGTALWNLVKNVSFAALYVRKLGSIALEVKAAIDQSQLMNNGRVSGSLVVPICVIPLINGCLYLTIDILNACMSFYSEYAEMSGRLDKRTCYVEQYKFKINLPLMNCAYAAGSVAQCVGYLVWFPGLQKDISAVLKKIRAVFCNTQ